ncbi:MAG TPA: LCP family protein [Paenibacillaceae bacterium]
MRWSRKKRWTAGVLLAVLLLGAIAYWQRTALALWGFDLFFAKSVERKLQKSYQPIDGRTEEQPAGQGLKEEAKRPYTLLLLGVDQRGKERGRSDTVILAAVRPADGAALMISVPRDSYVEMPGRGMDKMAHAYAYGEAKLAVETVEKLFGVPVEHYAAVNFQGFRDAVDAIGGVELPVERDLVNNDPGHEKFVVKAGKPVYNGEEALNFVRFREDAGGDISRTQRQKQFLEALLAKATRVNQWTKIPELFDIMGDNFRTDITPAELIEQAKWVLSADTRLIYSHTLAGKGRMINSLWYYVLDEEDVARASEWLKAWLDPAKSLYELPKPGLDEPVPGMD